MINISDAVPSSLTDDLGFSTLIVRVLDISSTALNDFTFYVLVNFNK